MSQDKYKSYSIDPETMVAHNRPIEGFIHVVEASALELSGTHTCHTECPRVECVQRREIERLKAKLEMAEKALEKICERGAPCLACDLGYENEYCLCFDEIDKTRRKILGGKEALAQIRKSR
jgi:hypothetical protein